ncbi:hypothetical protein [Halobacteriovorax sp. RT-2-6]|uniref:hypothetical protein n=1 Tax=unclassified Halobacteriovorax TaxID=2639665 RepID=UPI00399B43F2
MNILVIEDDGKKGADIYSFLKNLKYIKNINIKKSVKEGLREVVKNDSKIDFMILDMTLPMNDIKKHNKNVDLLHFAGEEVLKELKRYDKELPFIIFTAFKYFGEESNEMTTLENLILRIKKQNTHTFQDVIHYKSGNEDWKKKISKTLSRWRKNNENKSINN